MVFDVLANKIVSGEVMLMEWCPTMDLLALATTDSQLMVHRPAGWQRLFAHMGFDYPVTCLAWRPDGQVLAVGHANGAITLFGVEEGDLIGTITVHSDALTTFSWIPAIVADPAAKESPYVCSLDGLFTPLAQLPKQMAPQQYLLEECTPQLDVRTRAFTCDTHVRPIHHSYSFRVRLLCVCQVTLYKLLFEAPATLGFDIAVTSDAASRIHLAVHGRFSLGCLAIGSHHRSYWP